MFERKRSKNDGFLSHDKYLGLDGGELLRSTSFCPATPAAGVVESESLARLVVEEFRVGTSIGEEGDLGFPTDVFVALSDEGTPSVSGWTSLLSCRQSGEASFS